MTLFFNAFTPFRFSFSSSDKFHSFFLWQSLMLIELSIKNIQETMNLCMLLQHKSHIYLRNTEWEFGWINDSQKKFTPELSDFISDDTRKLAGVIVRLQGTYSHSLITNWSHLNIIKQVFHLSRNRDNNCQFNHFFYCQSNRIKSYSFLVL